MLILKFLKELHIKKNYASELKSAKIFLESLICFCKKANCKCFRGFFQEFPAGLAEKFKLCMLVINVRILSLCCSLLISVKWLVGIDWWFNRFFCPSFNSISIVILLASKGY